ncbi:MAG: hypothetical protein IK084_01785 [Bacteroidaceae bacterium]|nr:hypothetical protein [Bacteroidaceae bacterium]
MEGKGQPIKGVQINCPLCKKSFPVRVQELSGTLRLSVRCPHCKRTSEVFLQSE